MGLRNIAAERARRKLSQRDLAEKIGVSMTTVGNWENGVSKPSAESLAQLMKLFDCDADYLLADDRKEG